MTAHLRQQWTYSCDVCSLESDPAPLRVIPKGWMCIHGLVNAGCSTYIHDDKYRHIHLCAVCSEMSVSALTGHLRLQEDDPK